MMKNSIIIAMLLIGIGSLLICVFHKPHETTNYYVAGLKDKIMPGFGCAYLYSESNEECRATVGDITVGMGMEIPETLRKKKEEWTKKLGKLPKDLEFGWHKY